MGDNEQKKNSTQEAGQSASWDFKVEEKTLMDAISRDKHREELEKKNKVLKPEKKLRIDTAAQAKRREQVQKDAKQSRTTGKADSRKYAEENPFAYASVDKRLKSLIIDILFFVLLVFAADVFAPNIANDMHKKNQTVCNSQCLDVLIGGMKFLPLSVKTQDKFIDYADKIDTDPKEEARFNIYVVSKVILLGLYGVFFLIPQMFFGVSLGKALSKIRIEHADGGNLSWSQGFTREVFGKFLSLLTIVGPFVFLFQKNRRSLHDLISNSIVVENQEKNRD